MIRQYCPSELSSEQKANFLIGHLDGVAWEKVEELDEGARKSFDAVVTHLRHFFESPQQRYVARQKLSVCKQEPGEAAATFANRVLNLVRSATAGQDPATQKDKVLEEFQAVTKAQMVEQLLSEATAERLISPGKPENAAASRQPLRRDGPIYPERCYNCGGRGYRVIHRPSPPEPYRSKEDSRSADAGLVTTNQLAAQLLAVEGSVHDAVAVLFRHAIQALCERKDNLFVTPAAAVQRVLGIVMSKVVRFDTVKGLRIAFEGAPEAVSFSPSIYEFRVSDADLDEIVTAISRSNVSCAMRFSELPASKEAQRTLCALVRSFLPAHPEEGLLPLRVFKLTRSEREWISDRAGNFDNYRAHPRSAQQYMAQLFNAACSALAAVNHMNDDKRTHMLDAVIPDIEALPFRFDFTLADMSSECGWTNQRPVYLWIVGSRSLLRTITQQAVQSFEDRSIAVRLVVPAWAHRYAVRATARRARTRDNVTKVQVCVRLAPPPFGAEPVYELISQSRLFGEFPENSQATAVPNAIYGQQRIEVGPDGPQHENVSVSVGGRSFTLREDQVAAPKMSERRLPILAIQAAFGTGKTVVGALIAARTFSKFQKRVIATTSTNTAVAQFTDTLLRLDEYRNIHILRYVSDSALMEGAPQTPIDLHTILKRLPVDYADKLFEEALQTCRKYKRGIT
nr:unnamed protein product [Haemonchus contortus]